MRNLSLGLYSTNPKVDTDRAAKEVTTLIQDLASVGLQTEVRAGFDETLLDFVKAPQELLQTTVYNSRLLLTGQDRVKDWLYGVVQTHPKGAKDSIGYDGFEAEHVLSVYHLVNRPKALADTGITLEWGEWERVKSWLSAT
ncbi:hypothetical protein jhhlp_005028 [Lomentospora prolificans]|uniref:Anoctamin alpha-beta plait domain-containing protein n=1 Tax=Lomentospora prolificans TaxID=41688 RepID=A0A2N3N859_9PEZI|nr:hypothetical protein jhhlp_005028 [Lomentospora prolificans]